MFARDDEIALATVIGLLIGGVSAMDRSAFLPDSPEAHFVREGVDNGVAFAKQVGQVVEAAVDAVATRGERTIEALERAADGVKVLSRDT